MVPKRENGFRKFAARKYDTLMSLRKEQDISRRDLDIYTSIETGERSV